MERFNESIKKCKEVVKAILIDNPNNAAFEIELAIDNLKQDLITDDARPEKEDDHVREIHIDEVRDFIEDVDEIEIFVLWETLKSMDIYCIKAKTLDQKAKIEALIESLRVNPYPAI